MSTTAGDQINAALRLIGQLAEGETPSPQTSEDALSALNQMIDSWDLERLMIFSTQEQIFTWPAMTQSRTLGPTGDFVGERLVALDDSTYFVDPLTNLSFGVKQINQQQYNGIALKNVTATYPQVIWLNFTFPDIEMYIYPVPLRAVDWHFVSVQSLTQPANLSTALAFPPGYLRCFKYNLACEIAAEFGVEPPPTVQRIAMVSKRNLMRINAPDDVMSMPYSIVATRQRYNVFAGNF